MAKKMKAVGLVGHAIVSTEYAEDTMPDLADKVREMLTPAVTERPEVYDERADAKEAEQKASFAAAAVKAQDLTPEQKDILNSRESLKHPLAEGQGFFESPEGYIVVAQSDRDRVWCQKAAGGKGMFINPKR